ncbi:MAG: hypothetical protein PHT51_00615 [Patescibacteria group bacterium]|nr:hypothetical protein [Patescibacteria group bacterium]MDD4610728.1 hypothetical protein [Patescibacteria group bacterium]
MATVLAVIKSSKKMVVFSSCLLFVFLFCFNVASAADENIKDWATGLNQVASNTSLYNTDVGGKAEDIAKYIGGIIAIAAFLGVIFILNLVLAGYEWMTAGGDAEKAGKARKRIYYSIIALILFVASYVITYFIISSFGGATSYKIGN